jgi:hypothetical protein
MNKQVLYGVPDLVTGEYGPKDKLYNSDPGLAIALGFADITGLVGGGQTLLVKLVKSTYNNSVAWDAQTAGVILADGVTDQDGNPSTPAVSGIIFPDTSSDVFSQVKFLAISGDMLAESEAAGPKLILIGGADPASGGYDANAYTGENFKLAEYDLGDAGVADSGEFKVMPGSQYTQTYQADKDPGSRTSQVDALQIKVPLGRRDLASDGAVSGKGASGNVYLDEMLDAFAGSLARMKDIRGGTQWDVDSAKWHVDGDAYDDGKGLFHIDASLALDVPGGIKSGDAAWMDHGGISGQIVEFEQKFSSDGVSTAGVFSAPLSWLAAYNDDKINAHLGRLLADGHPELVAATTVQAWFISKISAATGGIRGDTGDACLDDAPELTITGEGLLDIESDMVVPGLLRDMSTLAASAGSGSDADPTGMMRNVDAADAASAYMQETRAVAGVKLDYVRFGRGNDSVRRMLDAGFNADSVFNDGPKKGVDIFEALVQLKEAGAGSGLANINSESIGDLQDVAAPAVSGEADNGKVLKYAQVDNVQSSVVVVFTSTDSVKFTVDSSSTLAGTTGDNVDIILAEGGTSPVTAVWDGSTPGSETMTVTYEEGVDSINDIIAALVAQEVIAAVEADNGYLGAAIAAGDSAIGSHDAAGGVNAIAGSWSAQADGGGSDGVISNVSFNGVDALSFTGSGGAYNGTVDLSALATDIKLQSVAYSHNETQSTFETPVLGTTSLVFEAGSNFLGAAGNGLSVIIIDSSSGIVDSVAFVSPTLTITADLGVVNFDAIVTAVTGAGIASDISCALGPQGAAGPGSEIATPSLGAGGALGGGGHRNLSFQMSDSSEFHADLAQLVDTLADTALISAALGDGAALPGWNTNLSAPTVTDLVLTIVNESTPTAGDGTGFIVDLSSLAGGGGGSEEHVITEKAISVQLSIGTELTMDVNVHPAIATPDDSDVIFKDKMAVYVNGVRQAKADYTIVAESGVGNGDNKDKLKFASVLDAGDYVIVELKATVA